MTITYTSRPLPECRRGCGRPMRRANWHQAGGVCTDCLTVPEALQLVHTRARLARVVEASTRRVERRIEALAARRAARPP